MPDWARTRLRRLLHCIGYKYKADHAIIAIPEVKQAKISESDDG
jgi:hypothetical protein